MNKKADLLPKPVKMKRGEKLQPEKRIEIIQYIATLLIGNDWNVANIQVKVREKYSQSFDWYTIANYKNQAMKLISEENVDREYLRKVELNSLKRSIETLERDIEELRSSPVKNHNGLVGLHNAKRGYQDLMAHIMGLKTDVQVNLGQSEPLVIIRSQAIKEPITIVDNDTTEGTIVSDQVE